MKNKEYLKTKQYIVNELGISKDMIREILKEEIDKVAKDLLHNYLESNHLFQKMKLMGWWR